MPCCGDEVGPAILSPGVILVDERQGVHLYVLRFHVPDETDIIHRGVRGCAEHVVVFGFLKDAWRAAIHQHQHLFQFLRNRSHRQAIARADVAEHDVDLLALIQVAKFLDLLGRPAVLVDNHRLDFHAAKPKLVVGSG